MWNLDSGFLSGIPDSLSCIPGSKAQNFGFHEQTFFRVPDSTGKNFTNSGIQVSAHGANEAIGQSGHNCTLAHCALGGGGVMAFLFCPEKTHSHFLQSSAR